MLYGQCLFFCVLNIERMFVYNICRRVIYVLHDAKCKLLSVIYDCYLLVGLLI